MKALLVKMVVLHNSIVMDVEIYSLSAGTRKVEATRIVTQVTGGLTRRLEPNEDLVLRGLTHKDVNTKMESFSCLR